MIISIDKSRSNGILDALGAASSRSGASIRVVDWNDGSISVNVLGQIEPDALTHPAITAVHQSSKPYRLASKEHREKTVVRVGDVEIGSGAPVIMAGPCVVSDVDQLVNAAVGGQSCRCDDSSWRRVQTAHIALLVPGSWRRRSANPCGSARRNWLASGHGSDGTGSGRESPPNTRTCCRSARATWPIFRSCARSERPARRCC